MNPTAVYLPLTATPTVAAPPVQTNDNTTETGSSGGYSGAAGGDKDCPDFATHAEAQAFFEAAGAGDPHRLDRASHYSMCRTMTDELMACLFVSWLAGARSSLLRIRRTLGLTEHRNQLL